MLVGVLGVSGAHGAQSLRELHAGDRSGLVQPRLLF